MPATGEPRSHMSESSPLISPGYRQEPPARRFSRGKAGAEPGINPRKDGATQRYGHFKQDCVIHVTDHSTTDMKARRMSNDLFIKLCRDEQIGMASREGGPTEKEGVAKTDEETEASSSENKPPRPKSVRWINIGGIDWEVLSALVLRYELHSLALEDVLHEQGHNQSKADYYHKHLFLRILCHWLGHPQDNTSTRDEEELESIEISRIEGETSTPSSDGSEDGNAGNGKATEVNKNGKTSWKWWWNWQSTCPKEKDAKDEFEYEALLQRLRKISALKGDRVDIRHEPLFIFFIRDGTVISIRPSPNLEFTRPIEERLHEPDSILRSSADASILVESLLDLVVDRVLEVIQEYQNTIIQLEQEILLGPNMNTVRHLHILSGDLIMHKRTLEPIRAMIDGLRRYDVDRWAALADDKKREELHFNESSKEKGHGGARKRGPGHLGKHKNAGYFSYRAKLLLADVYDHMEFALASIDMFSGISENLVNYAFNMASYDMNTSMRRLTLATIIFLPLALLTGYFGMNFQPFPAVDKHSDLFFWEVAILLMIVLLPIFLYPEFAQYVKKRVKMWRVDGHH
ncbi:magnesium transporter [Amanita muscaria]